MNLSIEEEFYSGLNKVLDGIPQASINNLLAAKY